jgi:hypothetical protein
MFRFQLTTDRISGDRNHTSFQKYINFSVFGDLGQAIFYMMKKQTLLEERKRMCNI